jgi:hypothetical protein
MKRTMLMTFVSFFNELVTEKQNFAQDSGYNPHIFVSFYNELDTERKTMLVAFVSFLNELSTERKTMLKALGSIPRSLFHFLMSLLQRGKLCSWLLFRESEKNLKTTPGFSFFVILVS